MARSRLSIIACAHSVGILAQTVDGLLYVYSHDRNTWIERTDDELSQMIADACSVQTAEHGDDGDWNRT